MDNNFKLTEKELRDLNKLDKLTKELRGFNELDKLTKKLKGLNELDKLTKVLASGTVGSEKQLAHEIEDLKEKINTLAMDTSKIVANTCTEFEIQLFRLRATVENIMTIEAKKAEHEVNKIKLQLELEKLKEKNKASAKGSQPKSGTTQ